MSKRSDWKGKSKGNVLGYQIFIFLLKYSGMRAAYFVLYFVAAYYFLFAAASNRASFFYFHKIWKFGRFKSLVYIYKSYYKFGQTLLDKVAILAGYSDRFTYYFDGEEHLRALAAEGQGGILISAHVGNWEIAGHFLKKLNRPINIVLFDAEHQQIKALLEKNMKKRAFKIIAIKDDFSHLLEIHNAIRNKEFICVHGDRFVSKLNTNTYRTQFLGYPALFPLGPFELATRLKIPYTFVFAIKETNTHYHFYATPGKREEKNAEHIIEEYLRALEKLLQQFPEQWFNYYDFWEKPEVTDVQLTT